jgi:hypothetical protein
MNQFTADEINLIRDYGTISDADVATIKARLREIVRDHADLPAEFRMGPERVPQNTELPIEGFKCHVFYDERKQYAIDINVDGTINIIVRETSVDLDPIRATCELKPFPWTTAAGTLAFRDGALEFDGAPVKIRNLNRAPVDHDALHEHEFSASDGYIPMPEYDQDGMIAFVANRYAWGMNVRAALLSPEDRTVYCWTSYNFDHPQGVAVRRKGSDVEIYLNNDGLDRRVVYKGETDTLSCIDNAYRNSSWVNLRIHEDFERMGSFIKWAADHPEFTDMDAELTRLSGLINAAAHVDDYAQILLLTDQYLAIPHCETGQIKVFDDHTGACIQKYNNACALARLGEPDRAMARMLEIESEWKDWVHIETDPDLASLHDRDDWKAMLARHFQFEGVGDTDDEVEVLVD